MRRSRLTSSAEKILSPNCHEKEKLEHIWDQFANYGRQRSKASEKDRSKSPKPKASSTRSLYNQNFVDTKSVMISYLNLGPNRMLSDIDSFDAMSRLTPVRIETTTRSVSVTSFHSEVTEQWTADQSLSPSISHHSFPSDDEDQSDHEDKFDSNSDEEGSDCPESHPNEDLLESVSDQDGATSFIPEKPYFSAVDGVYHLEGSNLLHPYRPVYERRSSHSVCSSDAVPSQRKFSEVSLPSSRHADYSGSKSGGRSSSATCLRKRVLTPLPLHAKVL